MDNSLIYIINYVKAGLLNAIATDIKNKKHKEAIKKIKEAVFLEF